MYNIILCTSKATLSFLYNIILFIILYLFSFSDRMRTFYLQQYEKEYILARDLVSTERNSLRQFSEYHHQNNVSVDSTNQKLVVKKNEVKDHPCLESIDNFPNRGLTFYSTELYAYWKNRPKVTKESKEVSTMSNRPTFMTRRKKIKEMIDECVNEDYMTMNMKMPRCQCNASISV